jgi:hypothetical protein
MSSNIERMQKLFPNCPVCKSDEGYEPSVFYPNVKCKSCQAEWVLYKDEMELKRVSNQYWDKELLNKKLPFTQWKKLVPPVTIKPQLTEKIFAPIDYVGGHIDYKNPAVGYILLKPDSIKYIASEGSLNKMDLEIPIEKLKGLEIRTAKEITFTRWFLIGAWSILFKKKTEYLVLSYEDEAEMLQHMIFDFHSQRKNVDELIGLLSYLKKKKAGMKSLT